MLIGFVVVFVVKGNRKCELNCLSYLCLTFLPATTTPSPLPHAWWEALPAPKYLLAPSLPPET